ncbi:MAG: alpha/beta fold hydrolase [Bacteroidota bacterium]
MLTLEKHRSRQQFWELPEGRIAYVDEGSGPAILLIHGVPTSSWLYRHMIPLISQLGYRVIAPDLLGYGNSSKPKGVDIYSPDKQSNRLLGLMQHLNIDSWTHVCHDAGGIWTWELLLQAVDCISHLVILNTIAYKQGFHPPMEFKRGARMGKWYTSLYKSKLFCKLMVNATLKNGLAAKHCELDKEDRRGYWLPMSEGVDRALYQFFTSFSEIYDKLPVYNQQLAQLRIPIMSIWGKQDKILRGEEQIPQLQAATHISPEDVHLLEDAAHFIQEEYPDKLANWIAEFARK